MSNFCNPAENRVARKEHKCSYCAENISKGDTYTHQTGNHDGVWFESKMHRECFADMCEFCDGEYIPYANERPNKGQE